MTDKVKALLEKVSKDEKLREQFKGLKGKEELLAKANELGFDISEEDLAAPEGELSEKDLADVTGGNWCHCYAVGGGGGTEDDGDTFGCACVGYGQGGDGHTDHWTCYCVVYGEGIVDSDRNDELW